MMHYQDNELAVIYHLRVKKTNNTSGGRERGKGGAKVESMELWKLA